MGNWRLRNNRIKRYKTDWGRPFSVVQWELCFFNIRNILQITERLSAAGEKLELDLGPGLKALAFAVILLAVRDVELNNDYSVDAERFLNESIELKFWLQIAGIK